MEHPLQVELLNCCGPAGTSLYKLKFTGQKRRAPGRWHECTICGNGRKVCMVCGAVLTADCGESLQQDVLQNLEHLHNSTHHLQRTHLTQDDDSDSDNEDDFFDASESFGDGGSCDGGAFSDDDGFADAGAGEKEESENEEDDSLSAASSVHSFTVDEAEDCYSAFLQLPAKGFLDMGSSFTCVGLAQVLIGIQILRLFEAGGHDFSNLGGIEEWPKSEDEEKHVANILASTQLSAVEEALEETSFVGNGRNVFWSITIQGALVHANVQFSSVDMCQSILIDHFGGWIGGGNTLLEVVNFAAQHIGVVMSMDPCLKVNLQLPSPMNDGFLRIMDFLGDTGKQTLLDEVFYGQEHLMDLYLLLTTMHISHTKADAWLR